MTEIQRQALRMMDERNIGAYLVFDVFPADGEWIHPVDIREDEEKAKRVVAQMLRFQEAEAKKAGNGGPNG